MMMKILYSLINTILLFGGLWLFARKFIAKDFLSRPFKNRRENINKLLDEAAEASLIAKSTEEIMKSEETEAGSKIDLIKEEYSKHAEEREKAVLSDFEEEKRSIIRENNRLIYGLKADMHETVKKNALEKAKQTALLLMGQEPYVSAFRKKERDIAKAILSKIQVTPGDIAYLKQKDVLYVTLTSTFPLEQDLVDEIGEVATEMVAKVGGKISYWVRTDPSLVGGLLLRVGDTVYDGTISDLLYRMTRSISRSYAEDFSPQKFADVLIDSVKDAKIDIGIYQLGRVISISDGICWLDGLADIMYGEVVEFIPTGERGMILDIEQSRIGCIIFGRYEHIEAGNRVRRIRHMASIPVGEAQLGRVVNPLGQPIDGLGTVLTKEYFPIEHNAPKIIDRKQVTKPLHTGIKAIDALVPIGKGQRELIIGDRQTGKTSLAIDAIINQKGKNVICIYVAVGQKETTVADIMDKLKKFGALEYTVIVCADAYSSASMQYIAPFAGTAIGEYFMYKGRDVLIVYDDLSKHAVAYRELSLLLHRPSGREAYPGDVFYLHSRLLERSACLSDKSGGGSMTALPIVETQAGDISAYIPTNVISITDGQIFLETELFNQGQRPAINVGLSVSRVGGAAQLPFMKKAASLLRLNLAQYRELESFAQFGADLDENTKKVLDNGARIMASLNQQRYSPVPHELEALLIFTVTEGYAANIPPSEMINFEKDLFEHFQTLRGDLLKIISSPDKPSKEDIEKIRNALREFVKAY